MCLGHMIELSLSQLRLSKVASLWSSCRPKDWTLFSNFSVSCDEARTSAFCSARLWTGYLHFSLSLIPKLSHSGCIIVWEAPASLLPECGKMLKFLVIPSLREKPPLITVVPLTQALGPAR